MRTQIMSKMAAFRNLVDFLGAFSVLYAYVIF